MSKPLCLLSALTIWVCGALSPVAAGAETSSADAAASTDQVQGSADASAADAAPSADQAGAQGQLQEITVTATRTAESIIQVPISVTALTSANLQAENIQDFADYAQLIPDLTFAHSGGNTATGTNITIRGIQGTNTTAFYIDDTPVPQSIDPRILDIQRIEVLRGPQGTLFGESSMGGAIRIITDQPDSHSFSGEYTLRGGYTTDAGSPNAGFQGVLNVPVVSDTLALRVSAYYEHDGGWLTRTFLNQPYNPANANFFTDPITFPYVGGTSTEGDQAKQNSAGASIALRWDVTHNFTATARILGQSTKNDGVPVEWGELANPNGGPQTYLSSPQLTEIVHMFDYQAYSEDNWYLPSLTLVYTHPAFTFTSTTSYFERLSTGVEADPEGEDQVELRFNGPAEYYALPVQDHVWLTVSKFKELTEEDRVAFNPIDLGILKFDAVLGYFWTRQWTGPWGLNEYAVNQAGTTAWGQTFGLAASGAWPNNTDWIHILNDTWNTDSSWFGALNFHFFNKLTLSVGDRYFHLTNNNQGENSDYGWSEGPPFGFMPLPAVPTEAEFTGQSPRFSLTYEFTPDASTYVSASRGFRPGTAQAYYNLLPNICNADLAALGIAPSEAGKVAPDYLWDYEVGTKFHLHSPEMVFSGDVYEMDWTHMQQTFDLACNYGVTANAGEAKSNGAEIEATVNPVRELSIHGDAGYSNAHIVNPGPGEIAGEGLFLVPRWTAAGGFIYTSDKDYGFPFTSATGHVYFSMDYSYHGSDLSNDTSAKYVVTLPQYHLLSGRLGMRFENSTLSLNTTNLTNGRDNLGDYLSPGWGMKIPTILGARTPLPNFFVSQPRTYMLQYDHSF
jgi:iron complex outermembrane recepter protein